MLNSYPSVAYSNKEEEEAIDMAALEGMARGTRARGFE